ncbi:MAG: hypothetical protein L7U87_08220 [Chlamydiales bacterium]|nr:hypothetical protein [Chlamydiales bacterium]
MKFSVGRKRGDDEFLLVYNLEDGSFDSSTPQHSRWGSIAVNYLTLEVNENFEILYV